MLERRSKHIEKLAAEELAVARQFVRSELETKLQSLGTSDPLMEDAHEVVRGMVHKYENRVLCLLTAECAAYCRFCTRRRKVSDIERGRMDTGDIERWLDYLKAHPGIKEVIVSGGDALVVNDALFTFALNRIASVPTVKVIRIGTRVPVSAPELVTDEKLRAISSVQQPVYVGIHFEHPAELTEETVQALSRLRKTGAILYSQTVFLAGVNDDYQTLYELFSRLIEVGVNPYYLYRCDPVAGIEHFRVDIAKERRIVTELRKNLSGIACPTYVIDTPNGSGKIPVPLEFWEVDVLHYRDFDNKEHTVDEVMSNDEVVSG